MFETQEFVASCRSILSESSPQIAMKELMLLTVDRAAEVEAALGTPTMGGITTLRFCQNSERPACEADLDQDRGLMLRGQRLQQA